MTSITIISMIIISYVLIINVFALYQKSYILCTDFKSYVLELLLSIHNHISCFNNILTQAADFIENSPSQVYFQINLSSMFVMRTGIRFISSPTLGGR